MSTSDLGSPRGLRAGRAVPRPRAILTAAVAAALYALGYSANAAPVSWDGGGGGDTSWQNLNNWNPNGIPNSTSDVTFSNTGIPVFGITIPWSGTASANSISITTNRFLTLQGGTVLLLTSGDLLRQDVFGVEEPVTINSTVSMGDHGVWDVNGSGGLTVSQLGESVAGRNFTKTGNGFMLVQQPSWTGSTTISQGILHFDAGLTAAGPVSVASGATLQLNNASISPAVTLSGTGVGGTGALRHLGGDQSLSSLVTIASDGVRITADSGTLTLGGGMADGASSFGWVKGGAGTVVLDGTGSYDGNTVVEEGTLRIGAGGTTGSIAGNVTNNANLTFNRSDNSTYSGVISGTGSMTKSGAGVLTLGGANTYSGNTSVQSGVLLVNNTSGSGTGTGMVVVGNNATLGGTGSIAGLINFFPSSGGHLAPGASGAGTLTGNNGLNLNATVLDYDLATTNTVGTGVNDLMAVAGNLSLANGATFNLNAYGGDVANGTYKLITYTGTLSGNIHSWKIGTDNSSGAHGYFFSSATPGEIDLIVVAGRAWTGASSANWDSGTNWGGGSKPDSTFAATFPASVPATGSTITLTSGQAAHSLFFNNDYTLSGGDLNLSNGGITVPFGKTATIASALTGTGGITKFGQGTAILSGVNTYGGVTTINAGALQIGATTATITGSVIVNSGGSLVTPNGGATITATGLVELLGGDYQPAGNVTVDGGTIQGSGNLHLPAGTILTAQNNAAVNLSNNELFVQASTCTFQTGADLSVGHSIRLQPGGTPATLVVTGIGSSVSAGTAVLEGGLCLFTVENGATGSFGDVVVSQSVFTNSRFSVTSGATVTTDDLILEHHPASLVDPSVLLTDAGSSITQSSFAQLTIGFFGTRGRLRVTNGASFIQPANGTTTIFSNGTLEIDGGAVQLGTLSVANPSCISFPSGSLSYVGNLTVGAGGLFGQDLTLASNRSLTLTGTATVDATRSLVLSGGTFSTGSLVNNGTVTLNAGTLGITGAGGLTVGSGGLFGSTLNINGGMNISISQATTIAAGAKIQSFGTFSSGTLANSGQLNQTGGMVTMSGASANAAGAKINLIDSTLNLGSGANKLTNGGRINLIDCTVNGDIQSDPGGVVNTTGNVTLNGNNITGGELVLSDATLVIDGTQITTIASVVVGSELTKQGAGTLVLTGTNTYTGGTTVEAGTLRVKRLHENNAVIINAGMVQVLESSPGLGSGHPSGNDALVSRPSTVTVAAGATLDLTNNDLILDYSGASPAAAIEALVASGYNVVGDWQGDGITSSVAALDGNYVIAIADNAALAAPFGTAQGGPLFSGVDVDLTTILIKFTHRADVDLDGSITPNDAAIFGGNYSENDPAVWATGDMDYDGIYTPTDAAIFGGFYDESLASLPEPGVLAAAALVLLAFGRRRPTTMA